MSSKDLYNMYEYVYDNIDNLDKIDVRKGQEESDPKMLEF